MSTPLKADLRGSGWASRLTGLGLVALLTATALGAQKGSMMGPLSIGTLANSSASNRFVEIVVSDTGKFTLGTLEGDPRRSSDNNKALIYGHPSPSTSDTMVRVNGVSYSLHTGVASNFVAGSDYVTVTLTTANVQVIQKLSMVKGSGTRNTDTVEINYKIKNVAAAAQNVSLRIQLDTMLGSNDGAPFRVPGTGEVTNDLEFDNSPATLAISSIPLTTLVFDSLGNPSVTGLFQFDGVGATTPDRVVLGYWPASVGAWDYTVNPARSFLDNNGDGVISGSNPDSDSSAVVWWGYPDGRAFNLAANQEETVAIRYGLGDYTFSDWKPFQIGLFSPSELVASVSGGGYIYSPSPFTASAFFSNVSGSSVTSAQATIRLRPGFELDAGETATKPIEFSAGSGEVGIGKTAQVDWRVKAFGRNRGLESFSVVTQHAGQTHTVLREIYLTTISQAVFGRVTNDRGTPVVGADVKVLSGYAVVGSGTTQADGTYAITGIAPGRYTVRVTAAGIPDSYYDTLVTADADSGGATNPVMFAAGSKLDSFVFPNPVRQGDAKISFYTAGAASADVKIFTSAGQLIRTISADAPGAGWREVNWNIDGVANGVYLYQVRAGGQSANGKIAVVKWKGR